MTNPIRRGIHKIEASDGEIRICLLVKFQQPDEPYILILFENEEIFLASWWLHSNDSDEADSWKRVINCDENLAYILEPIGKTWEIRGFKKIKNNMKRNKETRRYVCTVHSDRIICQNINVTKDERIIEYNNIGICL